MNACSACKFWDPRTHDGECHRLPPHPAAGSRVYPIVRPDDWCGEYKPESTVTPIGPAPGGTPLALRRVG